MRRPTRTRASSYTRAFALRAGRILQRGFVARRARRALIAAGRRGAGPGQSAQIASPSSSGAARLPLRRQMTLQLQTSRGRSCNRARQSSRDWRWGGRAALPEFARERLRPSARLSLCALHASTGSAAPGSAPFALPCMRDAPPFPLLNARAPCRPGRPRQAPPPCARRAPRAGGGNALAGAGAKPASADRPRATPEHRGDKKRCSSKLHGEARGVAQNGNDTTKWASSPQRGGRSSRRPRDGVAGGRGGGGRGRYLSRAKVVGCGAASKSHASE